MDALSAENEIHRRAHQNKDGRAHPENKGRRRYHDGVCFDSECEKDFPKKWKD